MKFWIVFSVLIGISGCARNNNPTPEIEAVVLTPRAEAAQEPPSVGKQVIVRRFKEAFLPAQDWEKDIKAGSREAICADRDRFVEMGFLLQIMQGNIAEMPILQWEDVQMSESAARALYYANGLRLAGIDLELLRKPFFGKLDMCVSPSGNFDHQDGGRLAKEIIQILKEFGQDPSALHTNAIEIKSLLRSHYRARLAFVQREVQAGKSGSGLFRSILEAAIKEWGFTLEELGVKAGQNPGRAMTRFQQELGAGSFFYIN